MRAVRSHAGTLGIVQVDANERDGWQRVDVVSAGICSSDLHLRDGPDTAITPGHEIGGRTADGRAVAVLPFVACGHCPACLTGRQNLCSDAVDNLLGVGIDGGMADQMLVPPECARPLPANVRPEDACLVEPLAVALHGVHRAGVSADTRLLLIGAGPIGLGAVLAGCSKQAEVAVEDLRPSRVDAAVALGGRLRHQDEGDFDVVIDAAGTQRSLRRSIRMVRPGGIVGVLGSHWNPVTVDTGLQTREATLVPSFLYGEHDGALEFDLALELLAGSRLAEVAITHRFPFDRAAEAFDVAAEDPDAIKVVLHP